MSEKLLFFFLLIIYLIIVAFRLAAPDLSGPLTFILSPPLKDQQGVYVHLPYFSHVLNARSVYVDMYYVCTRR